MKVRERVIFFFAAIAFLMPYAGRAQEQSDSLVRLLEARSAKLVQSDGQNLRKVIGPARFLHNDTYLICDTALWNVDTRIIDAIGNVSIIQDGTVLTSDKMVYYSDRDLAEFRGSVVQLRDKDNNTLRTRHLDYNTKDSVAIFDDGGSMRDKDGQIIESIRGTYDSKIKTFTFTADVNMFTDSIFVKTSDLKYESDRNLATFGRGTDAWQEDNMLSSDAGWYDREREIFFFRHNVHVMTDTQEGWSDSLYFYRMTSDVEMSGNAQVTDTSRNVSALAGKIEYIDSLSKVTLTRKPAVISEIDDENGRDTVYFGADTMIYRTVRYCDIDSVYLADAQKRLTELEGDPVTAYRRKSAEEAAKAAEEAAKDDPNYRPPQKQEKPGNTASGKALTDDVPDLSDMPPAFAGDLPELPEEQADSLSMPSVADSLSVPSSGDSLKVVAPLPAAGSMSLPSVSDSTASEPVDTTKTGFLTALRNVKIYRRNMQIVCDSLEYSDVDSLARLFKEPIIWNEVTQQYCADSITAVIRGNAMEKVHLMSEAFIHMQEDETHFDQIKGTEMIAYFDENGGLRRFDALGGASGIFFLEENEVIATVNKKEAKMLSADFVDGNIDKIRYYEEVKSDAYPVVQLVKEEQVLKGFNWQPDKRPADRNAVTPLVLRPVERNKYMARPRAAFRQTDIYFPGYISDIYRQIAVRDSLSEERARQRRIEEELQEMHRRDSVALADSLAASDSLAGKAALDSLAASDSLASVKPAADSLSVSDSLGSSSVVADKKALRDKKAAERKAAREARIKSREASWAEKDRSDAEKAAAKQAKKAAKQRERKRKALAAAEKQARKDAAVLERYLKRLEAKAAKKARKAIST